MTAQATTQVAYDARTEYALRMVPMAEPDERSGEFQRFEDLTRRLATTPKVKPNANS